jgi:hypothetical protein
MLDVHPAHHAATTWRDFFIHIATIVLGLLIAISLEQTVEYFHHRHLGAEGHQALIEERRADETANEFNIFATRRHQQDLQRDRKQQSIGRKQKATLHMLLVSGT